MNDDLLVKYLLDEASEAEKKRTETWIKLSAGNLKHFNDLKIIFEKSAFSIDPEIDEYEALSRLNNRLDSEKSRLIFPFWLKIASVFVVVAGLGWFAYTNTIGSKMSISTAYGTRTQQLPDGSLVTLNKQSSLSFKGGFFNETRAVNLTGEAFFKVKADKSKPFVIKVNDIEVKVVGTAFNIKSYKNKTVVVVESGIVKVKNQKASVELRAGEKTEAIEAGGFLSKSENQSKLYNWYFTNELVCEHTPLAELVGVLNEKFKTNIVIVNPSIKGLELSTTFKNEPLKEILEVIEKTFKIKVEYYKDVIELK